MAPAQNRGARRSLAFAGLFAASLLAHVSFGPVAYNETRALTSTRPYLELRSPPVLSMRALDAYRRLVASAGIGNWATRHRNGPASGIETEDR
ncbi:MAG TPA: hypothetical protein VL742_04300 [Casimicrobiaceae bacterium]|nr:hypothetical protein [Casimicrobiaceae bacterium]